MLKKERQILIKKLLYRSNHMGCLENDCFFGKFAIHNLCKMDYADLQLYAKLLEENDATLLSWIMHKQDVPESFSKLFAKILSYNINKP